MPRSTASREISSSPPSTNRSRQPSGRKSYVYVNNRLEGNALTTLEAIVKILDPD